MQIESMQERSKCHSRVFNNQLPLPTANKAPESCSPTVGDYRQSQMRIQFETTLSGYHNLRQSRGTTVTLKNIFYAHPIRQRETLQAQEDYRKLLDDVRKLALINFNRSFSVQEVSNSEIVFRSKRCESILEKYCELYRLTGTDVEVTTTTKSGVLAECYFSERAVRQTLPPVQLTFINGLPSNELLPTVNGILTQQKHTIDFLIVVSFAGNDVLLTQENEKIAGNCLQRCLNQYKDCLKRRRREKINSLAHHDAQDMNGTNSPLKDQHKAIGSGGSRALKAAIGGSHDGRKMNANEEEDMLYRLSQPPEDRETTFNKCAKWLQTNDFRAAKNIELEKCKITGNHPPPVTEGKYKLESKAQDKLNFFDCSPPAIGKYSGPRKPENQQAARPSKVINLPKPKFYPQPPTKFKTLKRQDKQQVVEAYPNLFDSSLFQPSPVRKSFPAINPAPNDATFSFPEIDDSIKRSAFRWEKFKRTEPTKLTHHQRRQSPIQIKQPIECDLNPPNRLQRSSPLERNESPLLGTNTIPDGGDNDATKLHFCHPHFTPKPDSDSCSEEAFPAPPSPDNIHSTTFAKLPNAFAKPLFLDGKMIVDGSSSNSCFPKCDSPEPQFRESVDLVDNLEDFREICQETTGNYKLAIESPGSWRSSNGECDCDGCELHQNYNRSVENLFQPYNNPRNIRAGIGRGRYFEGC
ncbi:uncharacterized protein LOC129756172 isoform X2 [Uranotaenia lowii]|nr:uncharacterized protein LOC129756172 isoform X2 [Uranotaenia lowii]XP_055608951.1 uncharacterized protein LOC129756172 isoform X2 [Uranotaenia lowii]